MRERETREGTRVSLARAALSCAHYFQAQVTTYPNFVPFFLQKLLLHLNQVSTSHPKERFDLYHKLQNLFDKWMFHLRYVDVHVTYCRCLVQLIINEFSRINRTKNASDTPLFGLKDQKTILTRFGPESTVKPFLWDTFIQVTKSLVLEKCSHNLCICYLY